MTFYFHFNIRRCHSGGNRHQSDFPFTHTRHSTHSCFTCVCRMCWRRCAAQWLGHPAAVGVHCQSTRASHVFRSRIEPELSDFRGNCRLSYNNRNCHHFIITKVFVANARRQPATMNKIPCKMMRENREKKNSRRAVRGRNKSFQ